MWLTSNYYYNCSESLNKHTHTHKTCQRKWIKPSQWYSPFWYLPQCASFSVMHPPQVQRPRKLQLIAIGQVRRQLNYQRRHRRLRHQNSSHYRKATHWNHRPAQIQWRLHRRTFYHNTHYRMGPISLTWHSIEEIRSSMQEHQIWFSSWIIICRYCLKVILCKFTVSVSHVHNSTWYLWNKIYFPAITGPKADNPQCHVVCPDDTETAETTNHNKILVVNEIASTLISCGSVMQVSIRVNRINVDAHKAKTEDLRTNTRQYSTHMHFTWFSG